MNQRFDRTTLGLHIPSAFEQLKGKDANFEMVTSNLLQPLRLFFSYNIVTNSIAHIFVNTHCNGLKYENASLNGELAGKLFKNVLKFQGVTIHKNLTKEQIIQKLDQLNIQSQEFEAHK